jgi:hypothetical protein
VMTGEGAATHAELDEGPQSTSLAACTLKV